MNKLLPHIEMHSEWFNNLHKYNTDSNLKLWNCIKELTDDQFTKDINYSQGSIRNQMIHLAAANNRWLARLSSTALPTNVNNEDFSTIASAYSFCTDIDRNLETYVNTLNDSFINSSIAYSIPSLATPDEFINKSDNVWQILFHIVNHGTNHRAQVLRILHEFNAPTFEQDYMYHVWNTKN